jgi:hypothetical protein
MNSKTEFTAFLIARGYKQMPSDRGYLFKKEDQEIYFEDDTDGYIKGIREGRIVFRF